LTFSTHNKPRRSAIYLALSLAATAAPAAASLDPYEIQLWEGGNVVGQGAFDFDNDGTANLVSPPYPPTYPVTGAGDPGVGDYPPIDPSVLDTSVLQAGSPGKLPAEFTVDANHTYEVAVRKIQYEDSKGVLTNCKRPVGDPNKDTSANCNNQIIGDYVEGLVDTVPLQGGVVSGSMVGQEVIPGFGTVQFILSFGLDTLGSTDPAVFQKTAKIFADLNSDGIPDNPAFPAWAGTYSVRNRAAEVANAPEPATLAVLIPGLGALAWRRRRSRKNG
jgi:hypothetical protein